MQSGDVRSRATAADNLPVMSWGRVLEPAEAAAFRTFVDGTLRRGALRFAMPVSLDGATFEARVVQIQRSSLSYEALPGGRLRPRCSLYVYPASLYPVTAPAGLAVAYPAPDSVRLSWTAAAGLRYRASATDWASGRVVARQDVTAGGASAAATLACGPGTYLLQVARLVGAWTGPAAAVTDTLAPLGLAGVAPALALDLPRNRHFIGGGGVTLAEALMRVGGIKVVVGPSGAPQTVAASTLAYDYASGRRRLLLEGAGTNLFIGSAAPTAAQSITATAQSYTLSFWGTGAITLSGAAGAVVTGAGANIRTTYTFTPAAGSLTLTPSGSVTNVQVEAGVRASSYIATTTAAANRAADVCQLTPAALAVLSVAGPRTVAWRGSCAQAGYAALMSLSGQALFRRSTDGLQVLALVPLALGSGLAATAMDTAPFGIAIGWDGGGGIASVNSGVAAANAQAPSGALSSGHMGWASGVSGWIELDELLVWPVKGTAGAIQAAARLWA